MKIKRIITADNSPTLYVPELDEHYHSVNGAIQESMHVFINAGFKQTEKDTINILEVGFGTGLNALLTLIENETQKKDIYYETIEKFPLDNEIINQLEFKGFNYDVFLHIHKTEEEKETYLNKSFILKKIKIDLIDYLPNKKFDLIYFDAFAPDKQPELWTENIFEKLYKSTNTYGILVTYSAKGIVKQALRNVGYKVQRLDGPKGKRHMVRAVKIIFEK